MTRSLLFIALFGCGQALAGSPVVDTATLNDSGQSYQGVMSINQAAGDQSQQANARSIAIGSSGKARTQIQQQFTGASPDVQRDSRATIGGNAFSNGNGILGINQSAGAATQQANAVRVSITAHVQGLDDSVLDQQTVALDTSSDTTAHPGSRQVATGDQAFRNGRGVVQLNQSAGVGNRMGNTLSVRVSD